MKNIIIVTLSLFMLTSCVNHRSVMKWIKAHPEKVYTHIQTVIKTKTDTFRIPIKGDTISKFIVSTRMDTVFKEGRAEVKLIFRTDTINKNSRIYIKAICKPDTITLFDTDTITITHTTDIGIIPLKWYESFWNWIYIAIGVAAFFVINYYYKNGNTQH